MINMAQITYLNPRLPEIIAYVAPICMIVDIVLSSTTDKRVDEQADERADELADKQDGLTKAFQEVLAART